MRNVFRMAVVVMAGLAGVVRGAEEPGVEVKVELSKRSEERQIPSRKVEGVVEVRVAKGVGRFETKRWEVTVEFDAGAAMSVTETVLEKPWPAVLEEGEVYRSGFTVYHTKEMQALIAAEEKPVTRTDLVRVGDHEARGMVRRVGRPEERVVSEGARFKVVEGFSTWINSEQVKRMVRRSEAGMRLRLAEVFVRNEILTEEEVLGLMTNAEPFEKGRWSELYAEAGFDLRKLRHFGEGQNGGVEVDALAKVPWFVRAKRGSRLEYVWRGGKGRSGEVWVGETLSGAFSEGAGSGAIAVPGEASVYRVWDRKSGRVWGWVLAE